VQNVVLDSSSGILFTNDKKIIEESSSWPSLNLLINSIPKPPRLELLPKIKEQKVIAISSNGFYHWLIEDLAPFIFARSQFPNATILVFEGAPFYVKSFIEKYYSNIRYVPRFVLMDQYTFVSKGPDTEWVHPQDISILKEFFAPSIKKTVLGRKIYIPRVNSSRSPEFELALISKLADAGWVILETQGFLLDEQIEQISSAEVICGVHGAGLAGMVWMAANTTVIELGPENFVPCFSRLGEICNLQYFRIPYEVGETMNVNQVFSEIDTIISKSRFTG
jgi:capsular polysaccharide biosynthesis protein